MELLSDGTPQEVLYESERTVVQRTTDVTGRRPIVVKLPATRPVHEREIRQYQRCAEVAEKLPQLTPPTTMELRDGVPHLVMREVEGQTIAAMLSSMPLSVEQQLGVAVAVSETITRVHSNGFIHGDVEPTNVIVAVAGREDRCSAVLLDLEAAVPVETAITLAGEPQPPRLVRSPEQATGSVDLRSDLFALGLLLHELFGGADLFEGLGAHDRAVKMRTGGFIDATRTPYSGVLADIVGHLLEVDPAARYQSAAGVSRDLRRCLNSLQVTGAIPHFVIGTDQSSPAPVLDGVLVGRASEVDALDAMLDGCIRHTEGWALVEGSPGVGKSALLHEFGVKAADQGAIFAYGKLEPEQTSPYSALAEALRQLTSTMLAAEGGEFRTWQREVETKVRPFAGVLVDLVPDLQLVVPGAQAAAVLEGAETRNRLRRAVIALVEATATVRPVVMAIDDLHWVDSDTEGLIAELIHTVDRGFLFLGSCRSGEYDRDRLLRSSPHLLSELELDGLSESAVHHLLADAFGDSEGLSEVAALVSRLTDGNALFVKELIRRARSEGVVRFEAATGSWVWDRAGLANLEASKNVVDLLVQSIETLSDVNADIISSIACIGSEFTLADAIAASARTKGEVAEAIWVALDLRLMESTRHSRIANEPILDVRSTYRFSHDRVAEAALRRLTGEERQATHLRYGRTLRAQGDPRVFVVAHHLSEGLMLVHDAAERLSIAELDHHAARLAREQASFPLALQFYEAGIALLGPAGWGSHAGLTAELHLGAAEASFLIGDHDRTHEWLDTSMSWLEGDTIRGARISYLRLKTLVAQNRLQDALNTGVTALGMLGEPVRADATKIHAAMALLRAKRRLRRRSDASVLTLDPCGDDRIIEAQKVLAEMLSISYIVRPELFPILVVKAIELTLDHGLLPISPVAVATYGVLLAVATNDYKGSQRWGELALQLADIEHCGEFRNQATFLYHNFISHWSNPMADSLGPLQTNYLSAVESGDIEYAAWTASTSMYQSFNLGLPLSDVDNLAERLLPSMRSQNVQLRLVQATQQLCLNLMGRSDEPFLLAGESGYDERVVLPKARSEGDVVTLSGAVMVKMGLHFWYGDHQGVVELAEEAKPLLDGMAGTPNIPIFHMMNSLSRLASAPAKRVTRKEVKKALRLYRRWAESAPANYAAMYELIQGAHLQSRGDLTTAEVHLDRAVQLADSHRLPHYAALAREQLAGLYYALDRTSIARTFVRDAYEQWRNIGMAARLELLTNDHPWLTTADTTIPTSSLGVQALLEASQALSGEIHLDELLVRLVDHACAATGAVRGMLFTSDGARPRCRAHREGQTTSLATAESAVVEAPHSIVRYVERTGRTVRLDDAQSSAHSSDPHIRSARVRSVLTIPLRARDKVVGVLHLENGLETAAFSWEDEQILVLLSGQIGVSLENAELVTKLEEALVTQTALTSAQSRFIPDEFLRLFDTDDIRSVRVGDRVQRHMNILISDIRGYTRLVEQLSLTEAGQIAVEFIQSAEPSIIGNNGFVQDLRGDEVLALFPDSADDAVRAGLAMQRSQEVHNAQRQLSGGPIVRAGIGITAGDVMLSMVGGVNRMTCGVIGDAVNLASRVESLNKRYGSGLLISEQTLKDLSDPERFMIRRMERVQVVNRTEPVTIYEVYDEDPVELRQLKQRAQADFDAAFTLLDAGEIELASHAFERCLDMIPGDLVASLHADYCMRVLKEEIIDLRYIALSEK